MALSTLAAIAKRHRTGTQGTFGKGVILSLSQVMKEFLCLMVRSGISHNPVGLETKVFPWLPASLTGMCQSE